MTRYSPLAACALLALAVVTPLAQAQTAPAPNAAASARLARLKARQDAIIAAARASGVPLPTTTAVTPPPTVTPPTTATSAPTTTAPTSSARPTTSAPPSTSSSAAPPAVLPKRTDTSAIALDLDALKKTRPDRRHVEFVDLQARFGGLLSDPRAAAELKQHAQRIAYLQRIRALGAKANDANFVKSVDALITTEEIRDANALNAFRTGALPAGGSK